MKNANDKSWAEFQLLDLSYMKEISRGDLIYEREVTKVFIKTIPENLLALNVALNEKSYVDLDKIFHHMQSSISIMGLQKKLVKFFDYNFDNQQDIDKIKEDIDFITTICYKAVEEAKLFLAKIN